MSSVKLEILTPRDKFFEGDVEFLQVETVVGSEGYLANHVWGRKLLKENGKGAYRLAGQTELKPFYYKGGFVEIQEIFTVFTEEASYDAPTEE